MNLFLVLFFGLFLVGFFFFGTGRAKSSRALGGSLGGIGFVLAEPIARSWPEAQAIIAQCWGPSYVPNSHPC